MLQKYLLEIGLEEIPARFLLSLSQQLGEKVENFLTEYRVSFSKVECFATPRRLAVIVYDLAQNQTDYSEIAKGPALKIAKDEDGNWSKAALGFLKGQGATPEDIFIKEIKGIEYIHVNKFIKGLSTKEVLSKIPEVIQSLNFPVTMHWNCLTTSFIRPIHWLVSLLDNEIIPFEFVGIKADRHSRGHRFLGHDVLIESPNTYIEQMKSEYVMVDCFERQKTIQSQIEALAQEKNWQVPIDSALLEEVTSIVEWPTVFYGEFEEMYLEVPEQILVTAMKDHQRYFYAMDQDNHLLPIFISVRNGNAEHIENVIKGNQKVLKARLEDALFFYKEDLKHDLSFYLDKLEQVNEHFKLGTLADKQRRVVATIETIYPLLGVGEQDKTIAVQAAKVYKYDLMTQTVGEFDELQGEIGSVYAKYFGLDKQVATVIKEQYLPKTSGGVLPSTQASQLLTLADKLDTLIHYFNAGLIPTGSNDPYALRRQAAGIVEIILASSWQFDLAEILQSNTLVHENEELFTLLVEFIKARVSVHLERETIDYDIIQSVSASNRLSIKQMIATAHLLQQLKQKTPETYRQMIESITRVVNLGIKVEAINPIDATLAQTKSEEQLIDYVISLGMDDIVDLLQQLSLPIQTYFEENMVNDANESIKNNRYAIMKQLTDHVLHYFDPRVLISKF